MISNERRYIISALTMNKIKRCKITQEKLGAKIEDIMLIFGEFEQMKYLKMGSQLRKERILLRIKFHNCQNQF